MRCQNAPRATPSKSPCAPNPKRAPRGCLGLNTEKETGEEPCGTELGVLGQNGCNKTGFDAGTAVSRFQGKHPLGTRRQASLPDITQPPLPFLHEGTDKAFPPVPLQHHTALCTAFCCRFKPWPARSSLTPSSLTAGAPKTSANSEGKMMTPSRGGRRGQGVVPAPRGRSHREGKAKRSAFNSRWRPAAPGEPRAACAKHRGAGGSKNK